MLEINIIVLYCTHRHSLVILVDVVKYGRRATDVLELYVVTNRMRSRRNSDMQGSGKLGEHSVSHCKGAASFGSIM